MELLTIFESGNLSKILVFKYLIVIVKVLYNILIGKSYLNELRAVVSTPHLTMKFPATSEEIVTI